MRDLGAVFYRLTFLAAVSLVAFVAACQPEQSSSDNSPEEVGFASETLPVSSAAPGDMLALPVSGSSSEISKGFYVRFKYGAESVAVPPLHVDGGKAFVMVPPMPESTMGGVEIALLDSNGDRIETHPQTIGVSDLSTNLQYTRSSFDAAVGGGLAAFVNLAVDAISELETHSVFPSAEATTATDALVQFVNIFESIEYFNNNLSDAELARLQQLLDNSGLLDFLADAGGVSLSSTGSQSSPMQSWLNAAIESALLKADFASLLIGEVRGALTLLAYVMNQVAGWPIIGGSWATNVAAWATGLASTLKPAHDLINTMIPCDLVQITPGATQVTLLSGGSSTALAYGRFETEGPFNQQLFTATVTSVVNSAAQWVTGAMSASPVLSPYTGYVSQVAALVPGWLNNWLQQNGYYQASVVPGQNYTVFTIDNFNLDMSQYRFDVAGIVANLLNLPYGAVNAFFSWIGVGVGQPVGGFEGVGFANSGIGTYYAPSDTIWASGAGNTSIIYKGVVCQEASGWWGQWGFYAIRNTNASVPFTVY